MLARIVRTIVVMLLTGVAAGPAFAAPILSVTPASTHIGLGSAFVLDVRITGVTDLFAFGFDVDYGPAPVRISGVTVTEGAFLASGGGGTTFAAGAFDNAAGTLPGIAAALSGIGPTVSGSGVLVNLGFIAVALGATNVMLSNIQLLDSTLTQIDFDAPGTAVVEVVPEPATSLLVALGGAMLALRRRAVLRRQQS